MALFVLSVALVLSITACEREDKTSGTKKPGETQTTPQTGKAPETEKVPDTGKAPDTEKIPETGKTPDTQKSEEEQIEKHVAIVCAKCKMELKSDLLIKCISPCTFQGKLEEYGFICMCGNEVKYGDLTQDSKCSKCGSVFIQANLTLKCPKCGKETKVSDLKCDECLKAEEKP